MMADDSPETMIRVEGLTTYYGERRILDGASLEAKAGETLVILGGSGTGKSTLLRHLIRLEPPPRSGHIYIMDRDIYAMSEDEFNLVRQKIGMAFQGAALFNSMTIEDNVALPLRELTELEDSTIRIVARMKLEQVGLSGVENYLPSQLSGGMKKRAGVAGILGGVLFSMLQLGQSLALVWHTTIESLAMQDIWTGLIKSLVFGAVITEVGCFEGFTVRGGAEGVGKSTTASVVNSIIMVIAADVVFTALFYYTGG